MSPDLVPIPSPLCPLMGPVTLDLDPQWDLHSWSLTGTVAPCHRESPPLEEPCHSGLKLWGPCYARVRAEGLKPPSEPSLYSAPCLFLLCLSCLASPQAPPSERLLPTSLNHIWPCPQSACGVSLLTSAWFLGSELPLDVTWWAPLLHPWSGSDCFTSPAQYVLF